MRSQRPGPAPRERISGHYSRGTHGCRQQRDSQESQYMSEHGAVSHRVARFGMVAHVFRKLESKTNPVSWFAVMEGRGKRNQDCAWRECATVDCPGPLRETKVEGSPVGFASPRTAFLIKAFRTKGSGWRDRSPYRLSPCPLGLWGELSRPQGPWSGDRSTCAAANADRSAHSLLIKRRSPCKKSKLSPDDDTGHILTTLFWVVGNV